jgi:inner membrane protein
LAIFGHIAVGMAAGSTYVGAGARWDPRVRAMAMFSGLAVLPDVDVLGTFAGIPFEHAWGHRGATHSLSFALLVGLIAWAVSRRWDLGFSPRRTTIAVTLAVASHGLLDTMTDGSLAVALLWPFSDERFLSPWRPLRLGPAGIPLLDRFGYKATVNEWPLVVALSLYSLRPRRTPRPAPPVA